MADRYLLESGGSDGYLHEDGSGVLLLEAVPTPVQPPDQPNPIFAKLVNGFIASNLLLTTLATPFNQTDWPNPQPFKRPITHTHSRSLAEPLNAIFREPTYAPRVTRGPIAAEAVPNLLSTTLAPAQVDPFKTTEWPVAAQRPSRSDVTPNLSLTTLASPVTPNLWANPQSRASAVEIASENLLGTTLAPAASLPFGQSDWPLSRKATRLDEGVASSLLATTLAAVQSPFVQSDWPLLASQRAASREQYGSLLETTLATPFLPSLWPNPAIAKLPQVSLDPNILATTLAAIEALPFAQFEWPLPKQAKAGGLAWWSLIVVPVPLAESPTLTGRWANVVTIVSPNERIAIKSGNERLDIHGANPRVDL